MQRINDGLIAGYSHWMFSLCVFLLIVRVSTPAFAQGTYEQSAQSVDIGGGRATSANYTIDAALGAIGGVVSELESDGVVRHGYAGQLYEPTGFALAASPLTIDEEGTRLIQAATLNDDATLTRLDGANVTWSVVDGPIAQISADGFATAAAVYEDTPATVRGQWDAADERLTLTILDTLKDNYGMYAADGIDDDWQITWYGLENPLALPGHNPFGTGDNLFKFYAGLNPTDPDARFSLRIGVIPGHPDRKNLLFGPVAPGRVYTAQFGMNLKDDDWADLEHAGDPVLDGDQATLTDMEALDPLRIYRLSISWPR